MSKRETTKKIVGWIVQYGTGTIVYGIIRNNIAPTRIDHKIGVGAASLAIGGVVADAAVKYSDQLVDELFDAFDKLKK